MVLTLFGSLDWQEKRQGVRGLGQSVYPWWEPLSEVYDGCSIEGLLGSASKGRESTFLENLDR